MSIACARMYNIAPEARAAWRTIFAWASGRTGVPLEVIEHAAPAPLDDLWARLDMGCVLMCGWPYAMADPRPRLIAVPVPSPPRYGGKPVYFTDLVVRADSAYRNVPDTFGGRLAWTLGTSHSGYNALRHHLLRYRTNERPALYRKTVGPLVSPVRALQAVVDGAADIAPLDSLCLDLLRRHAPERAAAVRVIETTEPAPFPPLVASPGADPEECARLQQALLCAHADATLRPALEDALIRGFAAAAPEVYDVTVSRADMAVAAGYGKPG